MQQLSRTSIKSFLLRHVAAKAPGVCPDSVPDTFDFLTEGVIDSLGIIELVVAIEKEVGFEIDFETLAPEELTVIGPLSDFIERAVAARLSAA